MSNSLVKKTSGSKARGRYSQWVFSLFLLGCALQPNILIELSLIYFSWLYEKSSYEDK